MSREKSKYTKTGGVFLYLLMTLLNTLRPRQNGRHFADVTIKCIFFNENVYILIKISPKLVPHGSINNTPALVQIMAWRRPGDKPLSEPMMVSLSTHIRVTRPQWVKFRDLKWVNSFFITLDVYDSFKFFVVSTEVVPWTVIKLSYVKTNICNCSYEVTGQ